MTAHAQTSFGGDSTGTSDRTRTITTVGTNLLVVGVFVANNSQTAPTVTDDQGGTYYQVPGSAQVTLSGSTCTLTLHVRTAVTASGVAHVVTATTGSNDAGIIAVEEVSGSLRYGSQAVKSYGFGNGTSGNAPTATHNATPLTTNMCLFFCGSADGTTAEPSGYTERGEATLFTPTTCFEMATIDSGNTTAAIASTLTQSTDWCCAVLELDASAAPTGTPGNLLLLGVG